MKKEHFLHLLVMGIPVMTIEFSLGRASRKSPVRIYHALAPKGSKWYIHGYMAMIGNYLLMMFYTTVGGWMIQYFLSTAQGKFNGHNGDSHDEQEKQIEQDKRAASILSYHVRKLPDISDPDGTAGTEQNKAQTTA